MRVLIVDDDRPSVKMNSFLLREEGYQDLANRLDNNITLTLDFLLNRAEGASLGDASTEEVSCGFADNTYGCSLYSKLKKVTDDLKGEFTTALGLEKPARAGGDND